MTTVTGTVSKKETVTGVLTALTGGELSLADVWSDASSASRNAFVDVKDTEIIPYIDEENIVVTDLADAANNVDIATAYSGGIDVDDYLGGLGIVTLSTEAAAAIVNIESNGGTLTNKEKYFVSIWVDRMQANADWALIPEIQTYLFADDLCNGVGWVLGTVATKVETGGTINQVTNGWQTSDGANTYIETNIDPNALSGISGQNINFGAYAYSWDNPADTGHSMWLLQSNVNATYSIGCQFGSSRCITHINGNQELHVDTDFFLNRGLYSVYHEGTSSQKLLLNGVVIEAENGSPTDSPLVSATLRLGAYFNNGENTKYVASMAFVSQAIGFDHLDFYIGFEDFRTSLHPEILYNFPQPTGHSTSYRTGDDFWIQSNMMAHFEAAFSYMNGVRPTLVAGSWNTLNQNNAFGNTNRFTAEDGTQTYTNNLKIDHLTGRMWYMVEQGSQNWDAHIDAALGSLFGGAQTQGSYTDWFLLNRSELASIRETDNDTEIPSTGDWHTSTSSTTSTSAYNHANTRLRVLDQAKTNSDKSVFCRLYLGET